MLASDSALMPNCGLRCLHNQTRISILSRLCLISISFLASLRLEQTHTVHPHEQFWSKKQARQKEREAETKLQAIALAWKSSAGRSNLTPANSSGELGGKLIASTTLMVIGLCLKLAFRANEWPAELTIKSPAATRSSRLIGNRNNISNNNNNEIYDYGETDEPYHCSTAKNRNSNYEDFKSF